MKIRIYSSNSKFGSSLGLKAWSSKQYNLVVLNGHIGKNLYFPFLNASVEVQNPLPPKDNNIDICLIGEQKYTIEQLEKLFEMLPSLLVQFNIPAIDNIEEIDTGIDIDKIHRVVTKNLLEKGSN